MRERSHHNEKPTHRNWRVTTARESPCTTAKTQHGHISKYYKKEKADTYEGPAPHQPLFWDASLRGKDEPWAPNLKWFVVQLGTVLVNTPARH